MSAIRGVYRKNDGEEIVIRKRVATPDPAPLVAPLINHSDTLNISGTFQYHVGLQLRYHCFNTDDLFCVNFKISRNEKEFKHGREVC